MKRCMMWCSSLLAASKSIVSAVLLLVPLAAMQIDAQPLPYQSPHETLGTVTCASSLCHGSIKLWKDSNVLQNEYLTWSRIDKHARGWTKPSDHVPVVVELAV